MSDAIAKRRAASLTAMKSRRIKPRAQANAGPIDAVSPIVARAQYAGLSRPRPTACGVISNAYRRNR